MDAASTLLLWMLGRGASTKYMPERKAYTKYSPISI
jgi:hypothetical protein